MSRIATAEGRERQSHSRLLLTQLQPSESERYRARDNTDIRERFSSHHTLPIHPFINLLFIRPPPHDSDSQRYDNCQENNDLRFLWSNRICLYRRNICIVGMVYYVTFTYTVTSLVVLHIAAWNNSCNIYIYNPLTPYFQSMLVSTNNS
jgi:hypothetical protein